MLTTWSWTKSGRLHQSSMPPTTTRSVRRYSVVSKASIWGTTTSWTWTRKGQWGQLRGTSRWGLRTWAITKTLIWYLLGTGLVVGRWDTNSTRTSSWRSNPLTITTAWCGGWPWTCNVHPFWRCPKTGRWSATKLILPPSSRDRGAIS